MWLIAVAIGGRYIMEPPSSDPAADLELTVIAIVEGAFRRDSRVCALHVLIRCTSLL